MRWASCSIDGRITDSQPTRWVNAVRYTVPRMAIRITGIHHRGPPCDIRESLAGGKEYADEPGRLRSSLLSGGCSECASNGGGEGGNAGAGSGDMEPVYSSGI